MEVVEQVPEAGRRGERRRKEEAAKNFLIMDVCRCSKWKKLLIVNADRCIFVLHSFCLISHCV